jgi:hypothetical protein
MSCADNKESKKTRVTTNRGLSYSQRRQRKSRALAAAFHRCWKVVGARADYDVCNYSLPDEWLLYDGVDIVLEAPFASNIVTSESCAFLATDTTTAPKTKSQLVIERSTPDDSIINRNVGTEGNPSIALVNEQESPVSLDDGKIVACICFPSGEPFLQAKLNAFDPVSVLVDQVRDLLAAEFMLLAGMTMIPTEGDEARKPVQDFEISNGSTITLVTLGMTLAGRNRLTRKQRLERDIQRFIVMLEDSQILASAAKKFFERFKGSHDSELESRVGKEHMYVTHTATCINEIRSRAGLNSLSNEQVRKHMIEATCTTNYYGVLNKKDFVVFYRTMLSIAYAELKSDLKGELEGCQSREGSLRRWMVSGTTDFTLLGINKCGSGVVRLWRDSSCQAVTQDCFANHITWALLDGSFEIQGDHVRLVWTKKVVREMRSARYCSLLASEERIKEQRRASELRKRYWYQPRQRRQALAVNYQKQVAEFLASWVSMKLEDWEVEDKQLISIASYPRYIVSPVQCKEVESAFNSFNFSHMEDGVRGFVA